MYAFVECQLSGRTYGGNYSGSEHGTSAVGRNNGKTSHVE